MKILQNKFLRVNIVDLVVNEYEFGRFIMALKNLEESEDWPRIAGIHGNTFKPDDPGVLCPTASNIVEEIAETGEPFYCKHSVVSFIAWHAPYIYQFELLLNKYNHSEDKSYITLPYLDLTIETDNFDFLNKKEIIILYNSKYITVSNPLAGATYYVDGKLTNTQRNGYLNAKTKEEIMTINTVRKQLSKVLYEKTYEDFSSNRVRTKKSGEQIKNTPLEVPHNTIHNVIGGVGGNMTDIAISAFDPLFWLHHCNMDRYFYNWLFINTNCFTKKLDNHQILPESLELSQAPFFPEIYHQPENINFGWLNNTFEFQKLSNILDVENYPYTYNQININQEHKHKKHINLELIDIPIPMESCNIYLFLIPKNQNINNKEDYLAGITHWFGINRHKKHCTRCMKGRTNLQIDITDYCNDCKISSNNINNYEVHIEAYGLLNKDMKYTMDEIIKDGDYKINNL